MSFRKAFEHKLRAFRSYVLPSHIQSAKQTRAAAQPLPQNKPLCVFDFKSIKIDNVTGRYLYHLVTEFETLGYAIAYTNRFRFLATMEAKACKKLLLFHNFSIVPLDAIPQSTAVIVTDNHEVESPSSAKRITVDYDQVRAPAGDPSNFEFPFFVHPEIHESGQVERFIEKLQSDDERPMSLLFAGNAKNPKYDEPVLAEKYKVLSRVRALQIAEEALGNERVRRPLSLDKLAPNSESRQSLTIATTQDLRIPSEQWIETLAQADFYFACPGVEMPLCHNLIESLAAGSIPILQYPQYLDPALEDGVNCLVYHDKESLISALEKALAMPKEEVSKLSKAAQQYYQEHQNPGSFAKKMMASPQQKLTLFLNAYRIPR